MQDEQKPEAGALGTAAPETWCEVQRSRIPIRWGDMDAYGHVNNAVYFRYMEQARVDLLERLGMPIDTATQGPVIVHTACTFHLPLNYPGEVEVRVFGGPLGRSSIPTRYELRKVGEETLFATGEATIVWIDVSTGRSVPLPDALRTALGR